MTLNQLVKTDNSLVEHFHKMISVLFVALLLLAWMVTLDCLAGYSHQVQGIVFPLLCIALELQVCRVKWCCSQVMQPLM